MSKSRRSGGSFGSNPSHHQKSRGELIRDRYSTDRYPTAEDFIRAVEQDPDHFDPSNEYFFPHDYGNRFKNTERDGVRGFSGTDLKTNRPNNSNWIADNPIDVDVDVDPGSLSLSTELWGDGENSVDVVAGVDLVPLGVDINVNGDVGTIGVELGAPGDLFGVEGEISFNTTTGEVIGGGAGIELGGVNVSVNRTSHKGKTCTTVTVTYFGVGASYQHCKKDDEDDEKDPKKDPPAPNRKAPPPITQLPGGPGDFVETFYTVAGNDFYEIEETYQYNYIDQNNYDKGQDWNHEQTEINSSGFRRNIDIDKNGKPLKGTDEIYPAQDIETHYRVRYQELNWDYGPPQIFDNSLPGSSVDFDVKYLNFISSEYTIVKKFIEDNKLNEDIGSDFDEVYTPLPVVKIQSKGYSWTYKRIIAPKVNGVFTPPEPPNPPIPPEDDMGECCNLEPVMSMLRKLNQALAVDEVIERGLELPNEWILPTGKGRSKMKNYLEIAVFLAKMQDHLGVHPMTVQIADLSAGQDGNQSFKKFYPNGTKAIQEILTILHDENSDSADRLNLQMRLAILNTRIFVTVASIARSLRGVFQFLGAPLKEKRDVVPLPFDYTYGLRKNKGFSQNAAQDGKQLEEVMQKLEEQLNKNTESATEALLAKFLNDSDQPIMYETFDNSQSDLLTLLRAVNTQLKNNKSQ